jgi:hypothetical protein
MCVHVSLRFLFLTFSFSSPDRLQRFRGSMGCIVWRQPCVALVRKTVQLGSELLTCPVTRYWTPTSREKERKRNWTPTSCERSERTQEGIFHRFSRCVRPAFLQSFITSRPNLRNEGIGKPQANWLQPLPHKRTGMSESGASCYGGPKGNWRPLCPCRKALHVNRKCKVAWEITPQFSLAFPATPLFPRSSLVC